MTATLESRDAGSGAPASSSAPDAATATAVTPTVRAFLKRRRAWIVIAAVLVLGALIVMAIQGGARTPGPPLAADNPAPGGAKALVEVLRDHGVDVTAVRSFDAALDAADGATVLLYDEYAILDERRLTELTEAGERLVVVEPGFTALETLAPGVRFAGAASGPIDDVACDVGPAERAGSLSDGQRLVTVDDAAIEAGWQGCFRDGDFGFAVAAGPSPSGGEVTIVGSTSVFANGTITEAGNAALAIGLTGASDRLVWYLPGPGDADAADAPTLAELTPGWVSPVMVLAVVVVMVAGVWQGRRFGPLVAERLPVNVPAGETSTGRARLYARTTARTHALDQLRIGSVIRLARTLRLPRSAGVDEVADAAARATGRDGASVHRLLADALPVDDRTLVDLAAGLAELETEVQRSLDPRGAVPTDRDDPTGRRP